MNYIEFLHNRDKYTGEDHSTFLQHYGILGQKWGQRRWQNPDGTFNEEGKQRYFGKKNSEEKIGGLTPKIFSNPLYSMDLITRNQNRINQINLQNQNQNMINQINLQNHMNAHNMAVQNHQNFVNQVQLQNHLQNTPGTFMGQPDSKEAKKMAKEAKKLEKELTSKLGNTENYPDRKKIEAWLDKPENKEIVDSYINAYDNKYNSMSKEINELFKDYDDHEDKYIAKAAIYEALESNGDNLGNISSIVHWFITDDGNQGSRNSEAYYLQEKGMSPNQINKLWERQIEIEKEARANAKNAVSNTIINKLDPDLQYYIDSELYWKYAQKDGYTNSKMSNASEASGQDPKIVKKTQEITKKLDPSCGDDYTGWVALNAALEELNFSNKDYTELTSSDWNKINNKVNEIKAQYN